MFHIFVVFLFQNPYFIRCIKPNSEKKENFFQNELVSQQLYTSSIISYAKFNRLGYPKRVQLKEITDKIQPIASTLKFISKHRLLNLKFLQFLGYEQKDFQMGNDTIFFRLHKFKLFEKFILDFENNRDLFLCKMKKFLIQSNWQYMYLVVMMLSKLTILSEYMIDEGVISSINNIIP